jgi:hypothetical protein
MRIAVMGAPLVVLVAEAANLTGEPTVVPLVGELTVTCAALKAAAKIIINAMQKKRLICSMPPVYPAFVFNERRLRKHLLWLYPA